MADIVAGKNPVQYKNSQHNFQGDVIKKTEIQAQSVISISLV